MAKIDEKSGRPSELRLPIPDGTDPAVVSSLQHSFEEVLRVLLQDPTFSMNLVSRADRVAAAVVGVSAPSPALVQERMQRMRTIGEILSHAEWLSAEEINALQRTPPVNKSQPANDWKRRGRIYAVTLDGKDLYAAYQFDALHQPLPIVKEILTALGHVSDTWRIAAWFHFPNGWLADDGSPRAPKNALDRHAEVLAAASRHLGGYAA